MPYGIAIVLALLIAIVTRAAGMDRDRALYPVALIVIGSYYALFAAIGGSTPSIITETIGATVFMAFAVIGFRINLWIVAFAIAGHGLFDFLVHPHLVPNPGMPEWWPAFCGTIDIALAIICAILLNIGIIQARRAPLRDARPGSAPSSPSRDARGCDSGTSTRRGDRQASTRCAPSPSAGR